MVATFTPLQSTLCIAHGELRLVCGCLAMETHFMKLPTNSSCADIASRGSLELDSECCNRGQTIFMRFSTRRSVLWACVCTITTLRPLCGRAVVAYRHLRFTVTAFTVDQGSSSRADVLQTDLLEKWYPVTVPK